MMRSMYCNILVLFSSTVAVAGFSFGKTPSPQPKVRVCQNKDCCRQWTHEQSLPDTLLDLLPPDVTIDIGVTGCLSQCGKGPNVILHQHKKDHHSSEQVLLQGQTGPMHLADELQEHFGFRVPSKLVAAVTVMDKARKANTYEEKERCLSSVVSVLQNDPLLRASTANIRAHVLRAEVRYDYGMVEEALRDLSEALAVAPQSIPDNAIMGALVGRAWRARADCNQALGQRVEAEKALLQWARFDPSRRTKAMNEIQLLRQSSS